MNRRQLKKQDKKAMAILIGAHGYKPCSFVVCQEEGRAFYCWRCNWEYDEWDDKPAYDEWADMRAYSHPNFERWYGFDPDTGEHIPEDQRPKPMGHREARQFYRLVPPPGYRWRGKRVVKVQGKGKP